MIRFIFITIFLVSSFHRALAIIQPNNYADTGVCKITILEIHKKNGAYIIYSMVEKDSSHIAIVSLKNRCRKGEKLKVGEKYTIQINTYFENDILPDHGLLFVIVLGGKKIIVPSEGVYGNVYTSTNLVGLRIINRDIKCL